jgi:hypothetical protein
VLGRLYRCFGGGAGCCHWMGTSRGGTGMKTFEFNSESSRDNIYLNTGCNVQL